MFFLGPENQNFCPEVKTFVSTCRISGSAAAGVWSEDLTTNSKPELTFIFPPKHDDITAGERLKMCPLQSRTAQTRGTR